MAFLLQKSFMIPMLMILGTLAFEAMSRAFTEDAVIHNKFQQWMSQHGRLYPDDEEKAKRFQIFKENLQYVENSNQRENQTYKLSLNIFADLSEEEFLATFTGYKTFQISNMTKKSTGNQSKLLDRPLDDYNAEIPDRVDWREKGSVVTPVEYQGQCGCCWAFSTIAAVEGVAANGISLSAQQLVDCVSGNRGCDGGWMDTAFEYIINNQGITSKDNYEFMAQQGMCRDQNTQPAARITGYVDVTPNSEEDLKAAVAKQPVSAAITVCRSFKFYNGGVFHDDCGTYQNHAIAIVGYGTSENGHKYWLIKNSWGQQWGEDGYMRLLRDAGTSEGLCGIAMHASYPVVS